MWPYVYMFKERKKENERTRLVNWLFSKSGRVGEITVIMEKSN